MEQYNTISSLIVSNSNFRYRDCAPFHSDFIIPGFYNHILKRKLYCLQNNQETL